VKRFIQPGELSVFGEQLPLTLRESLVHQSLQVPHAAVLVCPRLHLPISRVLVVNQPRGLSTCFLDGSIELCRALRVPAVVLTAARTEKGRATYEQIAQERCAAQGVAADFDSLVGGDVRLAIAQATRWRRCSHVIVERHGRPWWRRFHADTLEHLLGTTHDLCILAYTGG
jgi:K+-sensing histidine kinase KdpD